MRVITGTARGRRLKELPGLETRPTTDKVKESMFNIIQFDIEGRTVLDLFSGTGQLGIEALSRGAERCTFVDLRKDAVAVIRENLAHCRMEERATVIQGDSLAFLSGCRERFDLVFLDPPYHHGTAVEALTLLLERGLLSGRAIAVCEVDGAETLPAEVGGLFLDKLKRYRFTAVGIYRKREESPIEDSSSSGQL